MKKQILAVVCSLSLLIAAGACKKKEEKPPFPQAGMPGQGQGVPPGPQPGMPGQPGGPQGQPNIVVPKGEKTVVVPDSVKGKWKAVILVVTDKKANKQQEYTVNLNSDLKIPNSNLKVSVSEYLPDFRMEGLTLTSAPMIRTTLLSESRYLRTAKRFSRAGCTQNFLQCIPLSIRITA